MLKRLAQKTGVNIVMGCGHYTDGAHSAFVHRATIRELADEMVRDLTVGVDGIQAGFIGEIGTSATITENEWKVVEAAGIVSKETNAAIHFHTSLWERNGFEIVSRLKKMRVLPEKICIDHIDVDIREDYIKELLDMGVYVEFDNFGKEFFMLPRTNGWLKGRFAYDLERCQTIKRFVEWGYLDKILITNDLCLKSMLASFGGNGFAHIINNVMPMLEYSGLSEEQIAQIVIANPANFLDK